MAGVNIYKNEKQTGGTIYEILVCLTTCLFDNEVYQNILASRLESFLFNYQINL